MHLEQPELSCHEAVYQGVVSSPAVYPYFVDLVLVVEKL